MTQPVAHVGVAILEVVEPGVLAEIRAHLDLDDYIVGQLSDTELIVDPARVGDLARALEAKGLRPLMRAGAATPRSPAP